MTPYRIAALALLAWALVITEPSPHTARTGFVTKEACEKAAESWRANYKRHLKQANQNRYPNRRRRLAQATAPTKCVDEATAPLPPA